MPGRTAAHSDLIEGRLQLYSSAGAPHRAKRTNTANAKVVRKAAMSRTVRLSLATQLVAVLRAGPLRGKRIAASQAMCSMVDPLADLVAL